MFDCSKEIKRYHDDAVTLPETIREKLRGHRKANQDRLIGRQKESKKPVPKKFVKQGSYSMHLMIQHPENDYDIDDGAVFDQAELGDDMTPKEAKEMVCSALKDDRFSKQPEIHTNCVRIFYAEGHHVDVPVYRTKDNESYELASKEWRKSDPEGVTKWLQDSAQLKTDSGKQLRMLIRLLKKYARSRSTWNMPSGLVLAVLVNEQYSSVYSRIDDAFVDVISKIRNRLLSNIEIKHPVINESLSEKCEPAIKELRQKLSDALEDLNVLNDAGCTKLKALKAWKKVFNTDFFDGLIDEESKRSALGSFFVGKETPCQPVDKVNGGKGG